MHYNIRDVGRLKKRINDIERWPNGHRNDDSGDGGGGLSG